MNVYINDKTRDELDKLMSSHNLETYKETIDMLIKFHNTN